MDSLLEGQWQMIRGEFGGEAIPELITTNTRLTLRAGSYEVCFDGEVADRGRCSLHVDSALRTLVLVGEAGPNANRTITCRFQLAGERLRVAYGMDGQLPDDFTTKPGDQRYVAVYRRAS